MRRLLLPLLCLAHINPALADDIDDPVPGTGATYYDYALKIIPDLDAAGAGNTPLDLRYVEDLGDSDAPPQPELPYRARSFSSVTIQSGGKPVTLVAFDLGPADGWASGVEVLAAFDADGTLLDALNIGLDQMTGIRETIRISEGDDAILSYSEHFNSSQTYGGYALVMLEGGKFRTIDTVYTLSLHDCGINIDQSLAVSSPPSGASFWPLEMTVTEQQSEADFVCSSDDETVPLENSAYAATYTWDVASKKYVTTSDAFSRLAEVNEPRY